MRSVAPTERVVTAAEAARLLRITRHRIGMWRTRDKIQPCGMRGRSPLYRWDDLVRLEAAMATPHQAAA